MLVMAASLAACGAQPHNARCASPARNPDGGYSSYRTAGTMASGETVRLADGDYWTCRDGRVTVH